MARRYDVLREEFWGWRGDTNRSLSYINKRIDGVETSINSLTRQIWDLQSEVKKLTDKKKKKCC